MMGYEEFIEKIERIIPDKWDLSEEKTNKLLRNNKEFLRSLEAYVEPEIFNREELREIDRRFLFLRDIAGIETLVKNKNRKFWDEFSVHSSWILGLNIEQCNKIQNDLGTLYTVRNSIIHSLSVPYENEDFRRFFSNDFDKAILAASEYHRLILLRFITEQKKILSSPALIFDLRNYRVKNILEKVTPSLYNKEIAKKLEEITQVPSPPHVKEDYLSFRLPPKEERYYLGINSHGGLTTLCHKIIVSYESFYEHNERILPKRDVWNDICEKIKDEKRQMERGTFKDVIIIPKTHLSILFYLGYRFGRSKTPSLYTSFKGKLMNLRPKEEIDKPKKHWKITTEGVESKVKEAVIILDITRFVDKRVQENLTKLHLEKSPRITLEFNNILTGKGVDSQCIKSEEDILGASRAIERHFIEERYFQSLEKIHLFFRAPAAMAIMLGMHFHLGGLNVILYEYGKTNVEQKYREFYPVISCKSF